MKKKTNSKVKIGLATTAVVAIAGGYFLYGKDAKKNRNKARGWALKAKGEVLDGIEKAKELDKKDYEKMVARITSKYKKLKTTNVKEVEALARELKSQWNNIQKKVAQTKMLKKLPKKLAKKKSSIST